MYDQPIDKIPWHNTQFDWLNILIESNKIKGSSLLDLGCGTGKKSIFLAENGFERVIGIDIVQKAIEIARQNAIKAKVGDKCTFYQDDASELTAIKENETFDLILDWANLHGVPKEKRQDYINIINKHSHKGTQLLLRTFTTDTDEKFIEKEMDGAKITLSIFKENDIKKLFSEFEIIKTNTSKPQNGGPKQDIYFLELLMNKL